jgi:DnaK suppressor protein
MTDRSEMLQTARERTAQQLADLTAAFAAVVDSSDLANLDDEHDPEGATVGFERAQLHALVEQARTKLAELDAARQRLERGTYGACERCGDDISEARLDARPETRTCIACAAAPGSE